GVNLEDRVLINDGNGFFTEAANSALPFNFAFTLDAAFIDLNGDEHQDLLTIGLMQTQVSYRAYFNDGTGQFSETTIKVFGQNFNQDGIGIHPIKLNDDDIFDLYIANYNQTDILFLSQMISGLNDQPFDSDWALSANPVHGDFFSLSALQQSDLQSRLHLYDNQGRLLKDTTFNQRTEVEVTNLSSGAYWLRVQRGERAWSTSLIVH
ncbi:MAG: T9SS type A sorting domain-containing protein, partial [Bacteroidota bacterium]